MTPENVTTPEHVTTHEHVETMFGTTAASTSAPIPLQIRGGTGKMFELTDDNAYDLGGQATYVWVADEPGNDADDDEVDAAAIAPPDWTGDLSAARAKLLETDVDASAIVKTAFFHAIGRLQFADCPDPLLDRDAYLRRAHIIVRSLQYHARHNVACHKAPRGIFCCRFRYDRACAAAYASEDGRNGPFLRQLFQLTPKMSAPEPGKPARVVGVSGGGVDVPRNADIFDEGYRAIGHDDRRQLVFEHVRRQPLRQLLETTAQTLADPLPIDRPTPLLFAEICAAFAGDHTRQRVFVNALRSLDAMPLSANGKVVGFNVHLTALVASNTDVATLMTPSAASAAIYYLADYLTKGIGKPKEAASVRQIIASLQTRPSVADDAGTARRNVLLLLERLVNAGLKTAEFSSQLVAYHLLGGMPAVQSNATSFVFPVPAMALLGDDGRIDGRVLDSAGETRHAENQLDGGEDDDDDDNDDGVGEEEDHGELGDLFDDRRDNERLLDVDDRAVQTAQQRMEVQRDVAWPITINSDAAETVADVDDCNLFGDKEDKVEDGEDATRPRSFDIRLNADGRIVAVSQLRAYLQRPAAIADVSLYEFAGCFSVHCDDDERARAEYEAKLALVRSGGDARSNGRFPSRRYYFVNQDTYTGFYVRVRSKQHVPHVSGRLRHVPPLDLVGRRALSGARQRDVATWARVLFIPFHTDASIDLPIVRPSFRSLQDWILSAGRADGVVRDVDEWGRVHLARVVVMTNYLHTMMVTSLSKKVNIMFQGRATVPWQAMDAAQTGAGAVAGGDVPSDVADASAAIADPSETGELPESALVLRDILVQARELKDPASTNDLLHTVIALQAENNPRLLSPLAECIDAINNVQTRMTQLVGQMQTGAREQHDPSTHVPSQLVANWRALTDMDAAETVAEHDADVENAMEDDARADAAHVDNRVRDGDDDDDDDDGDDDDTDGALGRTGDAEVARLVALGVASAPLLTPSQLALVAAVVDHARDELLDPLRLLVLGGPGVGKTFTVNVISDFLRDRGKRLVCMAPTGAASALLRDGRTVHSLLSILPDKFVPLTAEQVLQVQSRFTRVSHIVIDEVSMLGMGMLARVSSRLRQIGRNPDDPFGGFNIIFTGDLAQLDPVRDPSVLHVASQKARLVADVHKPLVDVIRTLTVAELREQVRAAGDPEHAADLVRMRDAAVERPVTDLLLHKLKRRELDRIPAVSPSSTEIFAQDDTIVLTPSRELRGVFNLALLTGFLKRHGLVGMRWRRKVAAATLRQLAAFGIGADDVYQHCGESHQYFAPGAPIVVTSNVSQRGSIVNGTMGVLDDIVFGNEAEAAQVAAAAERADVGTVIDVPVPAYVLISVPRAAGVDYSDADVHAAGQVAEEEAQRVVVPLAMTKIVDHGSNVHFPHNAKPGTALRAMLALVRASTPSLKRTKTSDDLAMLGIPFELAFAATIHSAQGKTLKGNVVIDAVVRPGFSAQLRMTLQKLFVAMSRVTTSAKLFLMAGMTTESWGHLAQLRAPDSYRIFMASLVMDDATGLLKFCAHTNKVLLDKLAAEKSARRRRAPRGSKRRAPETEPVRVTRARFSLPDRRSPGKRARPVAAATTSPPRTRSRARR